MSKKHLPHLSLLKQRSSRFFLLFMVIITMTFIAPAKPATIEKKALSLQDIMKFKEIKSMEITDAGDWVAYETKPDRGNTEILVSHLSYTKIYRIQRGSKPVFSKDGKWLAATILPDFVALEKAENTKNGKDNKPQNGLALLNTTTGAIITLEKVKSFAFTDNSQWLYYCRYPEKKPEKKNEEKENDKKEEPKPETFTAVLRHLNNGQETPLEGVLQVLFDPSSRFLGYVHFEEGPNNGLFIIDLEKNDTIAKKIHGQPEDRYTTLAFSKTGSRLAFVSYPKKDTAKPSGKPFSANLTIWDGQTGKITEPLLKSPLPSAWMLPEENELSWTEDGQRLFFGLKPVAEYQFYFPEVPAPASKQEDENTLNNIANLVQKAAVDVWHWQDPFINPQQKKEWEKFSKQTYTALFIYPEERYLFLADETMPRVQRVENTHYALGFSNLPYRREVTWDGHYRDVYYVDLKNGTRSQFLTHHTFEPESENNIALSVQGFFVLYYLDKQWYLFDIRTGKSQNLTANLPVSFAHENHDTPDAQPGYGFVGWTENDRAVLLYDKYDIWEFPTDHSAPICLTHHEGRKNKLIFRVQTVDPEAKCIKPGERLLLTAYSDTEKYTAFYQAYEGQTGVTPLLYLKDRSLTFLKKAQKANTILFTRENFEEFPNLWVTGCDFKKPRQISDVNPQQKNFLWGKASMIEWHSLDGIPLQGIVIKPENYDPTKRYPVLVYYYETFTEELYRYNQVVINHRPCFPYYAGNGYVLFLPDLRYEVGRPGLSATKCLVPGVQKLIDLGIADPGRIGLHGHSWSGYQTAFIITQTHLFAAAIAGAPVANMTSAYNGIRWGVGVARQFQYEKAQSRIGPGLLEAPELYIENSPLFHAQFIQTPLLIEFGDQDDAVPWYQGIELYLTMRRLNKNCIFLQYNDEPHHLKKYANKVDYTIRMKEYLDHYLKGEPAPTWMSVGVPFRKK